MVGFARARASGGPKGRVWMVGSMLWRGQDLQESQLKEKKSMLRSVLDLHLPSASTTFRGHQVIPSAVFSAGRNTAKVVMRHIASGQRGDYGGASGGLCASHATAGQAGGRRSR